MVSTSSAPGADCPSFGYCHRFHRLAAVSLDNGCQHDPLPISLSTATRLRTVDRLRNVRHSQTALPLRKVVIVQTLPLGSQLSPFVSQRPLDRCIVVGDSRFDNDMLGLLCKRIRLLGLMPVRFLMARVLTPAARKGRCQHMRRHHVDDTYLCGCACAAYARRVSYGSGVDSLP
jgi:hypothetical protein